MQGNNFPLYMAAKSWTPSLWLRTTTTLLVTSALPWSKYGELTSTTSSRWEAGSPRTTPTGRPWRRPKGLKALKTH